MARKGGQRGRVWRLPGARSEVRESLLALLGLTEEAVVRVPDKGDPRRSHVTVEVTLEEREWLDRASQELGLSASAVGSRMVRLAIRALILHRRLLPAELPFEPGEGEQPWLDEALGEALAVPLAERLAPWLDALPDEVLGEIESALAAARARRAGRDG